MELLVRRATPLQEDTLKPPPHQATTSPAATTPGNARTIPPTNPDVNALETSSTSSNEDNAPLFGDPPPTSLDGSQLPQTDGGGTEDTNVDPPQVNPSQARALH